MNRYVAAAVYWPHTPDKAQLLAINGRVVVFDTLAAAQEFLPRLGGGRIDRWSEDKETVAFLPMSPTFYNRIAIVTDYDPYDVPNGLAATGIRSEAISRDWRWHIHWSQVVHGLIDWADVGSQDAFPATAESVN